MSIDYGLGQTNIDKETGIRYGCFCAGRPPLTEWFWDSVEHDYGPPTCPECGNDNVCEGDDDDCEPYRKRSCGDYNCPSCKIYFGSDEAYPEEAIGWSIGSRTDLPYVVDYLDTDGLILKSLYYTYAPFCSPCVPGAGNLDDAAYELSPGGHPMGAKTYCLDKSWYQGEVCPYPYWSVETNELVYSPPEKTPVVKVVKVAIDQHKDRITESGARQKTYRLDPAYVEDDITHEYICVSSVFTMFSGPETLIFPCDKDGNVTDWGELGGRRGEFTHEEIVKDFGYEPVGEGSGPIHPGCPICERDALADMPIVDPGPDWLDNIPVDLTGHLEGIDPNSVTDPYDEGDETNDPTETYGDGEPDEPDVGGEAGHD